VHVTKQRQAHGVHVTIDTGNIAEFQFYVIFQVNESIRVFEVHFFNEI
jgi:hypothetical protein